MFDYLVLVIREDTRGLYVESVNGERVKGNPLLYEYLIARGQEGWEAATSFTEKRAASSHSMVLKKALPVQVGRTP